MKDWRHGIGTLAIIPSSDNQARVVNYIEKYIKKKSNIGYCQKRFYHTRNLDFKNKSIAMLDEQGVQNLVECTGLEVAKENERMTVYRKKFE